VGEHSKGKDFLLFFRRREIAVNDEGALWWGLKYEISKGMVRQDRENSL
jgi:hypothetical protein